MNKSFLKSILIIAAVTFAAHYLYFRDMGLYEDDYFNMPPYFNTSFSALLTNMKNSFLHWSQGRALNFVPYVFTHIGMLFDGIASLYVIGYLILTANSILFYLLLKKVFPDSDVFALTGALIFCLFPSDTSKILLTHTYILQMSLMYLIIASLLYLHDKKILAYMVILGSLFTYETTFIVFFGIPLLKLNSLKKTKWELIRHASVLTIIIFIYMFIRMRMGEERMQEMGNSLFETIYKTAASLFIGPLYNIYLFLRAPVVTLLHPDAGIIIVSLLSFILLVIVYLKMKETDINSFVSGKVKLNFSFIKIDGQTEVSGTILKLIKISFASLILLSLAYALSFTHYPPTAVVGRMTSVHLAATFGASIFFACITTMLFLFADSRKKKFYFSAAISLYLSLLAGYGVLIQNDFVAGWSNQKHFWNQILKACPDINNNTLIFILTNSDNDMSALNSSNTSYISSYAYTDPIVLDLIFKFPKEWEKPPRAFYMKEGFEKKMVLNEGRLEWKIPASVWSTHWEEVPDSNIIFLIPRKNHFDRIDTVLNVNGKQITSKPLTSPTLQDYPHKKLYEYIFEEH